MLGAESVSLSISALEADWLELSHMTTLAAGKAKICHFYSIWQWTQLKIRALLLRRKENRCGSRQFAFCHKMSSPFQFSHFCGLLVWRVKSSLLKVCGPWTSRLCITW